MLLTVQVTEHTSVDSLEILVRKIVSRNIHYDIHIGSWTSESLMFHQAHKLLFCTGVEDWIVVADSDEFHHHPGGNIKSFVNKMASQGYTLANGLFLDRVAMTGALLELNPIKNIFEQFPLGCQMHFRLKLGTPKKVMIFKGNLRINRGHHRLALCWFWERRNQMHLTPWSDCPPPEDDVISPYPIRLDVHHFKWMRGQLEASESKARAYWNTSTGYTYQNVLKYLRKCGGVCVTDSQIDCKVSKISS